MSKRKTKPPAPDIFPRGDALGIGLRLDTLLEAREEAAGKILDAHGVPRPSKDPTVSNLPTEEFEVLKDHEKRLVWDARALLADIEDVRAARAVGDWELAMLLMERVGYSAAKASVRRWEPAVGVELESLPKRKARSEKASRGRAKDWKKFDAENQDRVRLGVERLMAGGMSLTAARSYYKRQHEKLSMYKIRQFTS